MFSKEWLSFFLHTYILMNKLKSQNWTTPWPLQIQPTNGEQVLVHDSIDYLRHVSLMHISNALLPFML